ncbi:MAG: DUF917 domain-containing protein [Candidatus Bathyarchaeia archaeon]
MKKLLDGQDLRDIVAGATLLGGGGGGSPIDGLKFVDKIVPVTKGIELVDPKEVPDDKYVAMIAGMGAPKVLRERGFDVEAIYAYEGLEKIYAIVGVKFSYIMPGEIGGFNTLTPMYVAAHKKLPVVDADGNGRAVPELGTTLYHVYGIPTSPFVLADRNNNVVVGYTNDPFDANTCENIARNVTVSFGMSSGFGTWIVNGKQIRDCLATNTVTQCMEIGAAMRESVKNKKDPVKAVLDITGGKELIRGRITDISTKTVAGFDFGKTTIESTKPKKKITIEFKNENIITRDESGEPLVMVPDLTSIMTIKGEALTNADTEVGMEVAILAIPAHEKWKHPKAFDVWKHILEKMGYTGSYKPI